jgi:ribosome maturation protein Sdo1
VFLKGDVPISAKERLKMVKDAKPKYLAISDVTSIVSNIHRVAITLDSIAEISKRMPEKKVKRDLIAPLSDQSEWHLKVELFKKHCLIN